MLLTPAMMLASQPAPTAAILEQNQANTSPREKGIVKFYDPKRKYGIATLDDGREIFITHSSLSNSYIPVENDTIEFEVNVTIRSSGSEKLETKNITCIQSSLIESNKSTTTTTNTSTTKNSATENKYIPLPVDNFSVVQPSNASDNPQFNTTPASQVDPFSVVQASTNVSCTDSAPKNNKTKRRPQRKKKKQTQNNGESKNQQANNNKNNNKNNKNNRSKRSGIRSNKQGDRPNNSPVVTNKYADSVMFQSPDPSKLPKPNFR